MEAYLEKITKSIEPVLKFTKRYAVIIFVIIFAAMGGYLVMRIGEYSRVEPDITQIDAKLSELKKSRIDEDTIQALNQLEDKNITIESLFDNGRTNPFED